MFIAFLELLESVILTVPPQLVIRVLSIAGKALFRFMAGTENLSFLGRESLT